MAEWIGIDRRARRCYGFDEVALVPGLQTINPNEVDKEQIELQKKNREVNLTKNYFDKQWESKREGLFKNYGK